VVPASKAPRVGVVFRPQLPPERLHEFVVSAESAGLDDVWLWEDCFFEGGLTSATAALGWTTSLRVGLGLMPVPLRNPALAAMEIATLARLFRSFAEAGASTVVLRSTADDPDVAATVRLAASARAALLSP
jgi:alkanesulfonate monooxygenase SsuD/methylene tetrahydromethanopterin reductase-like flavin-dependent oxidoreductase (luciferase family)